MIKRALNTTQARQDGIIIQAINMKEFKQLMEEVGFQISKLNDGTIEKDDFVQAINEIHEHFNTTII